MASRVLIILMAFSLLVVVTLSLEDDWNEPEDAGDVDLDLLTFILSSGLLNKRSGIANDVRMDDVNTDDDNMLAKRKFDQRRKNKYNRYYHCTVMYANCICDKKYPTDQLKHVVNCGY